MSQLMCESPDLVQFLGGDVEQIDDTICSRQATLKVVAHNGSHCGEEVFCICEDCANQLPWFSHHPSGWIENCQYIRENGALLHPQPASA